MIQKVGWPTFLPETFIGGRQFVNVCQFTLTLIALYGSLSTTALPNANPLGARAALSADVDVYPLPSCSPAELSIVRSNTVTAGQCKDLTPVAKAVGTGFASYQVSSSDKTVQTNCVLVVFSDPGCQGSFSKDIAVAPEATGLFGNASPCNECTLRLSRSCTMSICSAFTGLMLIACSTTIFLLWPVWWKIGPQR